MKYAHRNVSKQSGQSMTEFIVVWPMFFLLFFGIFEFGFLYRAKLTLNYASMEAARAGSINNGVRSYMKDALMEGMVPLYMDDNDSISSAIRTLGQLKVSYGGNPLVDKMVEIVSPNKSIFSQHRVSRPLKSVLDSAERTQWFIPNDNLMFRNAEEKPVSIGDENTRISVQDANLLKIKTFWCYKLKVPILDKFIYESNGVFNTNTYQNSCNAYSQTRDGYYIAISSKAIVRMQSPMLENDLT